MSRGVGAVLLNYITSLAKERNVRLLADFVSTDRNRMMYITYKFAGFKEIEKRDIFVILENNLMRIQPPPDYMKVQVIDWITAFFIVTFFI